MALIHFFRRRPEGYWFFVIMMFGALGAVIYFLAEVVPDFGLLRASFQRAGRKKRLTELDAIVKENAAIGNVEELADLNLEQGHYARARDLYTTVIKSPPISSVDPYYRRALCALALNDPPAAVSDLERVVSAEPKYDLYRATGLLAHAYALTGRTADAEAQFKKATQASTLSETYYNHAAFLAAQGRTDEAREAAQLILAKKATMPRFAQRRERPWFNQAKSLLKKLKT